ncbi:uncharacterized protein LOC111641182 [Centruroides sculpturatus]|uniref:uncharacterized protein LOC111641182 n=1 Tax=Centruroides sculpturatus TaxID=218467 RepID=UPI000C6CAE1F|nr:uncharacterized protein LOC111641182 [Centruroides sculpturatus]
MTSALKAVCFVVAFLGVVSAGVCVWVLATPEKFIVGETIVAFEWDGGDSPKLGIATAILMLFIGIAACIANIEKRFIPFIAGLVIVLIIAIAFMSVAIKDHQDLKKAKDIQKMVLGSVSRESNTFGDVNYHGRYKNTVMTGQDFMDKMMTKLKILAAVGAIDAIVLLIGIIIFYVKRPKSTSRNAMQMERTL